MRFLLTILFCLLCVKSAYSQEYGIPKVYIQLPTGMGIGAITREDKLLADMRIVNANGSKFALENLYDGPIYDFSSL